MLKRGKAFLLFLLPLSGVMFTGHPLSADTKGTLSLGKAVYQKNCTICHGRNGEGLGPSSNVPDFRSASSLAGKTDEEILNKIAKGGRGTGMPPWEQILSEEERWSVLLYLRSLPKK